MCVYVLVCVCVCVYTGTSLSHEYTTENIPLVTAGCCNLARHIDNARKYGVPVVSALHPHTDVPLLVCATYPRC